jgi:Flp pilus assembly pilin Flp
VEYALLVVFIALVAVLGATLLGNSISSLFSSIAGSL